MKNKMNLYLSLGIFFVGITFAIDHLWGLPEIIHGVGIGLGLVLEAIGVYALRHDLAHLRNQKLCLVRKLIKVPSKPSPNN